MRLPSTQVTYQAEPSTPYGTPAAESLPPAFPRRAAWGTADKLRAWQAEALTQYFTTEPRDFLAAATPGAGKTTFALRLATELLARHTVTQLVIVVPTEHLKRQWADAAHRVSIRLNPQFRNADGSFGSQFHGVVVTYAQIAADPAVLRAIVVSRPTLAILDEIHHGGDALSWGDGIRTAFEPATRRLALTGTPFRSDTSPIPFVTYLPDDDGARTSRPDYSYSYGRALADGVVRPVIFMSYAGEMRWRTKMGDEMTAVLGDVTTQDITAQAWRTALDASGEWIESVLSAADRRLSEVRRGVPDAAGLVLATDQKAARAYAQILTRLTGETPTVVLSDEDAASAKIAQFSNGKARWIVAVRMVSEGVDIPRLSVGVYATSSSTPLFFAQVVGRFVRARKRGETATIFLPSVAPLLALASTMELERDHVLDRKRGDEGWDDGLLDSANRADSASSELLGDDDGEFEALDATATFDKVLFDGGEVGFDAEIGSEEELDFIGIPGLLEPEQVRDLLAAHRTKQAAKRRGGRSNDAAKSVTSAVPVEKPLYEQVAEARTELHRLVSIRAAATSIPHGKIHAQLRNACGGPPVAQASLEDLRDRIATVRRWMRG